MIVASAFKIAVGVFAILWLCLILWGLVVLHRRTGGKFPLAKRDFDALRRNAASRWDPFGDIGIKRWYFVMLIAFAALMFINLMGW